MTSALRAEARRLLGRRLTVMMLLAVVALIGLFQLDVGSQVAPPSAAEVAQNQRDFVEYLRDWEAHHEEWEADCLDSGGTAEDCAQPRPDPADWGLAAVPFDQAVSGALGFAVYLGGLAMFIVLASFIGAEATTGSLATWLTFIPDRTTVLASKLVIAAAFSAATGAIVGVVTVSLSSVVTIAYGQPLTGFGAMAAMAGRGVIVVVIFGVLGFSVGVLTGSTGASIGVLLAGMLAIYARIIAAFASRWAERLAPWSPEVNLQAILGDGTTYQVSTGSGTPNAEYIEKTLSLAHGLGYWSVLLAAVIIVSWLVFRRRDIT